MTCSMQMTALWTWQKRQRQRKTMLTLCWTAAKQSLDTCASCSSTVSLHMGVSQGLAPTLAYPSTGHLCALQRTYVIATLALGLTGAQQIQLPVVVSQL